MSINQDKFLELQSLFLELTSAAYGEQEGWFETEVRGGIFGGALTTWLWLSQAMKGTSLAGALRELQSGNCDLILSKNSRKEKIKKQGISSSTGGFARARQRIPEIEIEDITDLINQSLKKDRNKMGKPSAYFIDGTLITLARTIEIQKEFESPKGAYGERNHPLLRAVFATDVASGVSVKPAFGTYRTSEQKLSAQVLDSLDAGALVIGDRNFGNFGVISHAVRGEKDVLVRLSSTQAHKFLKDEKDKGSIDKAVLWSKSYRDTLLDKKDPEEVKGRFIRFEVKQKGFRPITLYFFTTSSLSPAELAKLYSKRVDIETDIRQLKTLFAMEQLLTKSPEMTRKHLHILFTAYNMVRCTIEKIAQILDLPPRRISFKNALQYIDLYGAKMLKASDKNERQELINSLITALRQTKLPNKKKARSEPRMLTRRRSAYPLMRGSRNDVKTRLGII